jgi:hypothetical protein
MANSQTVFTRTQLVQVGNTTVATDVLGPPGFAGSLTFPANTLLVGDSLNLQVRGGYALTSGFLTLKLRFPSTEVNASLIVTASTNGANFELDALLTLQGNPAIQFTNWMQFAATGTAWYSIIQANNFDVTVANTMQLTAQFSIADPGNGVSVQLAVLEYLPRP